MIFRESGENLAGICPKRVRANDVRWTDRIRAVGQMGQIPDRLWTDNNIYKYLYISMLCVFFPLSVRCPY